MIRSSLTLIAAALSIVFTCPAQTTSVGKIDNSGMCSFTSVNASNSTFKIVCSGRGLNADQANQLSQILNIVTKAKLQFSEVVRALRVLAEQSSNKPNESDNIASTQNGIANAGGTIINSPVNVYGVTKPPPQIVWDQSPRLVQYEDPMTAIKRGKGIPPNPPTTVEHAVITITLKDDFQKPAFRITCDKPCSVMGISRPMPGSIEMADEVSPPNTYLVVVNYPRTFTKDVPVFLEVASRTEKMIRVLNVEPLLVP